MKKFFAILLAAAMLFAVCSFSAFADGVISTDDSNIPNVDINSFYYVSDTKEIRANGTLSFNPATRAVCYTVSCTNIGYDDLSNFHLWAQCAINYDDGTQDFDTATIQVLIGHGVEKKREKTYIVPSNKTVISLDAEYQVWYEQDTLWEGQIYYPLTLGINA